jgi:hypothetical protein
MTIGRATYQPGCKCPEDVGSAMNEAYCHVEHVGMVVSGSATAAMANGEVVEMKPSDLFYVPLLRATLAARQLGMAKRVNKKGRINRPFPKTDNACTHSQRYTTKI